MKNNPLHKTGTGLFVFQLLLRRLRLRREGLDQFPRSHQRQEAPEEPRDVHESREVVVRSGERVSKNAICSITDIKLISNAWIMRLVG